MSIKTHKFLFAFFITAFLVAGCAGSQKMGGRRASAPLAGQTKKPPIVQEPPASATSTIADEPSLPVEKDTPTLPSTSSIPEKTPLTAEERESLVNAFLEGAILEERNRFEEAGKAYAKALEIAPDSSYLGAITGRALLQSGKTEEAVKIAEEAIRKSTNEIEAYKVLGLAYRQTKNYEKAIEQYQKLLEIQPNSMDVLNELVSLYVRTQRFDESIELYRRMARIDVYQAFMYQYRIALILTQLGRYEEALNEYKDVARQIPNQFDVHFRIGKLLEILKQSDDAIDAYLTALQFIRNPQDELTVRNALGPLFHSRKSYLEAIHQYSRIKELDPDDYQAYYRLALIAFEREQFPEALKELDAPIKSLPGNFFFHSLRLKTMEKLQRTAEGYQGFLDGLQQAIEQARLEDTLLFLVELTRQSMILQMRELGFLPRAKELMEKSIAQFPEESRPLFSAAKIALLLQETTLAEQRLDEILSRLETTQSEDSLARILLDVRSWYDVRRSFQSFNREDRLIDALVNLRKSHPENADICRTLAQVYVDAARWTDAETQLIHAKDLLGPISPSYSDVLYQLAIVYDKMERIADVESLMNEVIRLSPEDSQAYNFLGYTYADRNIRLDEAVSLIQKALKLNPDDGNILDSMGWVYFRMGRIQEAAAYLERAIAQDENHPVILDHLGDARYQLGDTGAALQCWKKALENGPDYPYDFTPAFQERVMQKIQEAEQKPIP